MATTRRLAPALLAAAWLGFAGNGQYAAWSQTLPGAAPTSASHPASNPPQPVPSPQAAPTAPYVHAEPPREPARVFYAEGKLEVKANNSSLNSILRAVSKLTGMKITGGVAEQRVYGSYGPDAPAKVLSSLLDGTGVNFLLRERAPNVPAELVLTPRSGGASPPGPFSAIYNDEQVTASNKPDLPPPPPPPSALSVKPPMPGTPKPAVIPLPVSSRSSPAAQPPGEVKTPEQIYEALERLQQQKAQTRQQAPGQKQ